MRLGLSNEQQGPKKVDDASIILGSRRGGAGREATRNEVNLRKLIWRIQNCIEIIETPSIDYFSGGPYKPDGPEGFSRSFLTTYTCSLTETCMQMKASHYTYPSFALVMTQSLDLHSSRLPSHKTSQAVRFHPYCKSKSSRAIDLDDPSMVSQLRRCDAPRKPNQLFDLSQRTIDTRYDGPTLDGGLPMQFTRNVCSSKPSIILSC